MATLDHLVSSQLLSKAFYSFKVLMPFSIFSLTDPHSRGQIRKLGQIEPQIHSTMHPRVDKRSRTMHLPNKTSPKAGPRRQQLGKSMIDLLVPNFLSSHQEENFNGRFQIYF